jgi:alpha-glucosidase
MRSCGTIGTTSHGDPKEGRDYTDFLPEVHDVLRRMRTMTDRYAGNRLLIGETYLSSTSQLDTWYGGEARNELQLPMDLLLGFGGNDLNADRFRRNLTELNSQIHGSWPLLVFDNHDKPRSWGRFGDGVHDLAIAKAVATVLLTTRSTPLMYYGEELGMTTTDPTRIEDVKDPIGIVGWPANKGRDGERTPMQWDDSNPQAGFSAASRTWLPVASNYSQVNVKTETADPGSLLNWYKQLIHLRRSNGALHDGAIAMLDENDKDVLIYLRSAPSGESVLVAVNMSPTTQTRTIELPGKFRGKRAVHSLAASDRSLTTLSSLESVTLPPYASWVASVK